MWIMQEKYDENHIFMNCITGAEWCIIIIADAGIIES
jgi:hypothetical protein